MSAVEKIKTINGTFYKVEIPISEELREIKESCDFAKQREIAYRTLKIAKVRGFKKFDPYIVFSEFHSSGRAHAVWFKYLKPKFDP